MIIMIKVIILIMYMGGDFAKAKGGGRANNSIVEYKYSPEAGNGRKSGLATGIPAGLLAG